MNDIEILKHHDLKREGVKKWEREITEGVKNEEKMEWMKKRRRGKRKQEAEEKKQ